MTEDELKEIMDLWHRNNRIDAIRLLRSQTYIGLSAAKTILERRDAESYLRKQFVHTTAELIRVAEIELTRHHQYLQQLYAQRDLETQQENNMQLNITLPQAKMIQDSLEMRLRAEKFTVTAVAATEDEVKQALINVELIEGLMRQL